MAKKFYAQKDALGWPIPGTMMSTASIVPEGCIEIPAENVDSTISHPGGLRYFVRRDRKGKIIPNSLIISIKKPKGSVYEFKPMNNVVPAIPGFKLSIVTSAPNEMFTFSISSFGGTVQYSIDWGDNSPLEPVILLSGSADSTSHTYTASGSYTINIGFTDTSYNNLQALDAQGMSSLVGISDVSFLSNVFDLNLSNTGITSIDVTGMTRLNTINLYNCNVTDSAIIDSIFNRIYANNTTGGTIDLSGGTNAAPTSASASARADLMSLSYETYVFDNGPSFVMTFEGFPVANPWNVGDWNTLFGNSTFNYVAYTGNKVRLEGSAPFVLGSSKMLNKALLTFDDQVGYITSFNTSYTFANNPNLSYLNLAGCTGTTGSGSYTFMGSGINVTGTITLKFPVMTTLGSSVGNNTIFSSGFGGKTMIITLKSALMTANGGSPDGDIAYLLSDNIVTSLFIL